MVFGRVFRALPVLTRSRLTDLLYSLDPDGPFGLPQVLGLETRRA